MTVWLWLAAVAAETPTTQEIPPLDFSGLFLKMAALLVIIVILAFVLMRYLSPHSRARRKGGSTHFELLDIHRLEPKKSIHLVKVGKPIFAVGVGDAQVNLISEINESDLQR